MTETLLELSSRLIDTDAEVQPRQTNPQDASFHEVADGVGIVTGFSHCWNLETPAGIATFDTSLEAFGPQMVAGVRSWRTDPISTIVYTHGHLDHVGGTGAFLADAEERGHARPTIVAHDNCPVRFDRYDATNGYNSVINRRQFGWDGAFPTDWIHPDETFDGTRTLDLGGTTIELHHDRGETDDHAWAWVPDKKAVLTGDLFIWVFPNAGNPQKVQRYAADWADALRKMVALGPELLLPAHGLPIEGKDRIASVLDNAATALEGLVSDTVELMNAGATLDEIIHTVRVPDHLTAKPYLRPVYDEPEFVVRNIWRLYGGWYDGNPARLKPAPDAVVAAEVATLAGGASALAERARAVAEAGDVRLACQLAEWAAQADPVDPGVHAARAEVYQRRRDTELSLMSKGIFGTAAKESQDLADG